VLKASKMFCITASLLILGAFKLEANLNSDSKVLI